MTIDRSNPGKPLTVVFDSRRSALLREFAWAQGWTYRSAAQACVDAMLAAGGPIVGEPYGEPTKRKDEYNAEQPHDAAGGGR